MMEVRVIQFLPKLPAKRLLIFPLFILFLSNCSALSWGWVKLPSGVGWEQPGELDRNPVEGFTVLFPEEAGLDSTPLVELSKKFRKDKTEVRSLLILKDGHLVFERYAGGISRNHNHNMYSVTKSVTSLLLGICYSNSCGVDLDESLASAESILPGLLPSELNGKESIRLKDALRMSSGMGWDSFPKKEEIRTDADPLAIAWTPIVSSPPGTKFEYSNGDSQLAAGYLEAKSGKSLYEYAKNTAFQWLNIRGEEWYTSSSGRQTGGFGLRLRPIDMAKIGQLYLDGGKWGGRQILRPEWIAWTLEPGVDKKYGLQFWLSEFEGKSSFMANGKGGQFIYVIPHRRMVVVMTSAIWDKAPDTVLQSVLDAVKSSLHSTDKIQSQEKEMALIKELKIAHKTSLDPRLKEGADETRIAAEPGMKQNHP
ncbi:serine hydrolase [Leptospira wolffii]|uniref:serine hydrolase domain-containing protein n=1 Tax=Leptospira wolffii TaxID=409998 RepID=UPI00031E28C2|nr:beta-lactamase [Leptospira wolffii serovar Khorat str. Khorat-H2]TGK62418.1 serine hydrolase [Leptospira wolffii]TGK70642.1 serine hydrolase [Leptospira wolffii]TGK74198.1 serine hydrolase [Leptospira wolffii]TGL32227.1 serine hydrolase [Leptospira wolffii]